MDESDASRPAPATSPFDENTQLGRDLAAVDWASTALGPWQSWPASLVNTVRLITASRFAMWMAWGADLTFFCNDAYRRDTLGTKYPWALGRPAREVWSEVWADVESLIHSVVNDGASTWDERMQLFLERSGYPEETYHTFSYSPIRDDDGQLAGMLCVVSEDTGRVIGERRIALLRDLGSGLSEASTQVDVGYAAQRQLATDPYDLPFALAYRFEPDGRTAQLQWSTGVVAGSSAAPLVVAVEDDHELWHGALFGSDEHPGTDEWVQELPDDLELPSGGWSEPPTHSLAVPLQQLGAGDPYGYLVVGLNRYRTLDDDYRAFVVLVAGQIAAAIGRAKAYEEERERNEQLAELDSAKTTFFTNVSHELRTPLTLLLGPAADALADSDNALPAAQRNRVEVVQRNGERLLKLVNTLLDFSRLESGRVTARYEQLDLTRFTGELANMFESAFARSDVSLDIDMQPLPSRPYVDREMWSKIVLNLLSNALKATFTGGVTVRLGDRGGQAVLEVIDTGVGISSTEQDHLFERFHRVSGAELRSHEGSGIGLALVAELARLHGGAVSVESELGAGSTFRVTIPYGRDHLAQEHVEDRVVDDIPEVVRYGAGYIAEAQRWLSPTPAAPTGADRSNLPHVLVVDDNADMRGYIRGLLDDDYLVDTANDGEAALTAIRASPPDLVLTDVMMPVLDGFGLLAELRDDPALSHLPVVMLSARSGDEATVEGLEAGADDYLVKPFSARELLARVRANLELDRVRRLVTELERSRELLDNAEALAHIGSWEIDLHTGTVHMSAELCRIFGFPDGTNSVPYEAISGSSDEESVQRFEQAVRAAQEHRGGFDIELAGDRVSGGRFLIRSRGVIRTDESGDPRYMRGSTQDIREQRAAELALAAAHADREAAAREHAIATELQQNLLPRPSFVAHRLDIAAFYRAGAEGTQVGGDWYDAIDLGDGRTALVIGDVMGRGVRAAAVMGQLRAAVRAYARLDLPPAELIRLLDDTVREVSEDTIVTCVYAVFDPSDHSLVYANAGHLPPLLAIDGHPPRRLTAGGPPLGAGRHGEIAERVAMPMGATLVLYTDGLVERRGSDLDDGIDRVSAVAGEQDRPLSDLPDRLVDALLPDGPDDDVAILVCRATDSDDDQLVRYDVETGSNATSSARRFARTQLQSWQVEDTLAFDVLLSVSELVTNALHHGGRPIVLRMRKQNDTLLLEVRDSGAGLPRVVESQPLDVGGRGVFIVSRVAEDWGIRSGPSGKTVWARFRLAGDGDIAGGIAG